MRMKIVMASALMKMIIRLRTRYKQAASYQNIQRARANRKEMRNQSRKLGKTVSLQVAMRRHARQLVSYFERARVTN